MMRSLIRHQTGFGMVEVLVSLVIIMVGLLGLAGLHAKASQAELESYQRSQALVLLQDITNRIQANGRTFIGSTWTPCYGVSAAAGTGYLGTGASAPTVTTGCPATVQSDLAAWDSLLDGAAETISANQVGAMIGARGCIVTLSSASRTYFVSVAWQGISPTAAPPSGNNCAKDLYGNDAQRRVVSAVVRIPRLYP